MFEIRKIFILSLIVSVYDYTVFACHYGIISEREVTTICLFSTMHSVKQAVTMDKLHLQCIQPVSASSIQDRDRFWSLLDQCHIADIRTCWNPAYFVRILSPFLSPLCMEVIYGDPLGTEPADYLVTAALREWVSEQRLTFHSVHNRSSRRKVCPRNR